MFTRTSLPSLRRAIPLVILSFTGVYAKDETSFMCGQFQGATTTSGTYLYGTNQWGWDSSGAQCMEVSRFRTPQLMLCTRRQDPSTRSVQLSHSRLLTLVKYRLTLTILKRTPLLSMQPGHGKLAMFGYVTIPVWSRPFSF